MSRRDEFKSSNPNPAHRFLEWKSEKGCFSYYDKEQGQNIEVPLPFKFITLMQRSTVKGWHNASDSRIFANEVKALGSEELTVKSFEGGKIAQGLYNKIKPQVEAAGGHYAQSIYVVDANGDLVNVSLKGSAAGAWMNATQKHRKRLLDEWVAVDQAIEKKNGSITYTVPSFKFAGSLSDKAAGLADAKYKELEDYSNQREEEEKSGRYTEDEQPFSDSAVERYNQAQNNAGGQDQPIVAEEALSDVPF